MRISACEEKFCISDNHVINILYFLTVETDVSDFSPNCTAEINQTFFPFVILYSEAEFMSLCTDKSRYCSLYVFSQVARNAGRCSWESKIKSDNEDKRCKNWQVGNKVCSVSVITSNIKRYITLLFIFWTETSLISILSLFIRHIRN